MAPTASLFPAMGLELPADLLTFATPPKPSHVVLFVCGNPGLPSYYTLFLSTLSTALPTAAVFALGHLGHSPQNAPLTFSTASAATLSEQVNHKVDYVDHLVKKYAVGKGEQSPKLVLMGHSIGAWMCLETLRARPDSVSSLHLLFPTISHMLTSPNGRRLSPFFSAPLLPPLALTTYALSFLPSTFRTPLVSLLSRQSGPSALVTSGLVSSPGTVLSALSLAAEEMSEVKELDKDLLRRYGGKCWWYWAKGDEDGWVSESSVEEICGVLDEAGVERSRRLRCEEGMKHAFVLNEEHSGKLAERCAGWIRSDPQPSQ